MESHAKINLYLNVLGKRPDGYHEIETIFQAISLHDTLWITPSSEYELILHEDSHPQFVSQVPLCEKNLITRAFFALKKEVDIPFVRVELNKQIPPQGGLGGASSNAAAILLGMSTICGGIDRQILEKIAIDLGSDIRFFLNRGIFSATSRGEKLKYLGIGPQWTGLLVYPGEGMSTSYSYGQLILPKTTPSFTQAETYFTACEGNLTCLKSFCSLIYNVFQRGFRNKNFVTRGVFERLENVETVVPLLCGSGSCVIFFCEMPSLVGKSLFALQPTLCQSWEVCPEEVPIKIKYN